jgi:hypothetical protein
MMQKIVYILIFLIAGCTLPKRSVTDLKNTPPDQIVLVGKLSINKKLPESSHVIDVIGILDSGVLRAGPTALAEIDPRPDAFEKDDIMVKWDELFSVPYNKYPRIYVNGVYAYSFEKRGKETYMFPLRGTIRTDVGARYIYIGHISLILDDFFTLKSVSVKDEFESDEKSLARFKGIKKSLLRM